MNYAKPEAVALGPAARVIEQLPTIKGPAGLVECICQRYLNPAYELDE